MNRGEAWTGADPLAWFRARTGRRRLHKNRIDDSDDEEAEKAEVTPAPPLAALSPDEAPAKEAAAPMEVEDAAPSATAIADVPSSSSAVSKPKEETKAS